MISVKENKDFNVVDAYKKGIIKSGYYISPYDSRDFKYQDLVPLGAIKIPEEYESENLVVLNQGMSNMCAACSFAVLRYMQEAEQSKINTVFSPAFTYANRKPGEDFEGMYLRSLCDKAREGALPYDEFPGFYTYGESKRKFNEKKKVYCEHASNFKISSYYRCTNREQVQTAIIQNKGVMVGVPTYNSLLHPNNKGIVEYSTKMDINDFGGHCVLLVGWKVINNKFYWILHNSWGEDYGIKGRVYIPENYPWFDAPFAVVDNEFEMTWKEYTEKYYDGKITLPITIEPVKTPSKPIEKEEPKKSLISIVKQRIVGVIKSSK